jgi:acyl carrier protein
MDLVARTLQNLPYVTDVLLRNNPDGTLAAFISLSPTAKSIPTIDEVGCLSLPGYSLPNPIYFIRGSLLKDHTGEYDFRRMENEALNAETMSERQLLVRKIMAEVLDIDPAPMTAYSDFFLMGGTSLLLGRLCHRLRRKTGIEIQITDLFTESTICGIASMIEEKENKEIERKLTDVGNGTNTKIDDLSTATLVTEHLYEQDAECHNPKRSRSQNHPLCLIVQAIPFVFFYPLKKALTCE